MDAAADSHSLGNLLSPKNAAFLAPKTPKVPGLLFFGVSDSDHEDNVHPMNPSASNASVVDAPPVLTSSDGEPLPSSTSILVKPDSLAHLSTPARVQVRTQTVGRVLAPAPPDVYIDTVVSSTSSLRCCEGDSRGCCRCGSCFPCGPPNGARLVSSLGQFSRRMFLFRGLALPSRARRTSASSDGGVDDADKAETETLNGYQGDNSVTCAVVLERIVDSPMFNAIAVLIAVFALFADDLRLAFAPKTSDPAFYSCAAGIACVWLFELCVAAYTRPSYRWGYYFALDVLAFISMVSDIGWLWEPLSALLVTRGNVGAVQVCPPTWEWAQAGLSVPLVSSWNTCLFPFTASTSLLLVARIVRIFRWVRIVKFWKAFKKAAIGLYVCVDICPGCRLVSMSRHSRDSSGPFDLAGKNSPRVFDGKSAVATLVTPVIGGDAIHTVRVDSFREREQVSHVRGSLRVLETAVVSRAPPMPAVSAGDLLVQHACQCKGIFELGGIGGFDSATAGLLLSTDPIVSSMNQPFGGDFHSKSHSALGLAVSSAWLPPPRRLSATSPLRHLDHNLAASSRQSRRSWSTAGQLTTSSNFNSPSAISAVRPVQKIGTMLSDNTSRRIIAVVFASVILSTVLDSSTLDADDGSAVLQQLELWRLHAFAQAPNASSLGGGADFFRQHVQSFALNSAGPVALLRLCSPRRVSFNGSDSFQSSCVDAPAPSTVDGWVYAAFDSTAGLAADGAGDASASPADISDWLSAEQSGMCGGEKRTNRLNFFVHDADGYPSVDSAVAMRPPGSKWATPKLSPMTSRPAVLQTYRPFEYRYYAATGCTNASLSSSAAAAVNAMSEFVQNSLELGPACASYAIIDRQDVSVRDAVLSVFKTFAILVLVGVVTVLFTRDTQVLVVHHIERMVTMMKALRRNPLQPLDKLYQTLRGDQSSGFIKRGSFLEALPIRKGTTQPELHSRATSLYRRVISALCRCCIRRTRILPVDGSAGPTITSSSTAPQSCFGFLNVFRQYSHFFWLSCTALTLALRRYFPVSRQVETDSYETLLLENTILKVGGLLQVSFGEAGREILQKNIVAGGSLKPMVRGTKVDAIFGFCDVRSFTTVTECLQEEVMVYINRIGLIVHSATHRCNGYANKSIGDAFLLVWKLPPLPKQRSRDLCTRGHGAARIRAARDSLVSFPPERFGTPNAPAPAAAATAAMKRSSFLGLKSIMSFLSPRKEANSAQEKSRPSARGTSVSVTARALSAEPVPKMGSSGADVFSDAMPKARRTASGSAVPAVHKRPRSVGTASSRGILAHSSRIGQKHFPLASSKAEGASRDALPVVLPPIRNREQLAPVTPPWLPSQRGAASADPATTVDEPVKTDLTRPSDSTPQRPRLPPITAVAVSDRTSVSSAGSSEDAVSSAVKIAAASVRAADPAGTSRFSSRPIFETLTPGAGNAAAKRSGSSTRSATRKRASLPLQLDRLGSPPPSLLQSYTAAKDGVSLHPALIVAPRHDSLPGRLGDGYLPSSLGREASPVLISSRGAAAAAGLRGGGCGNAASWIAVATSRGQPSSTDALHSSSASGVAAASAGNFWPMRRSTVVEEAALSADVPASGAPCGGLTGRRSASFGPDSAGDSAAGAFPASGGGGLTSRRGSGGPSFAVARTKAEVQRRADDALAAFLKCLCDIHTASTAPVDDVTDLKVYGRHREIARRFQDTPGGYRVQMGFGLHCGWAIEGALGSRFKVEASYLSQHVNMAARLEAATKQYGVHLLVSHDFATQLSEGAQAMLRLIDCVVVKGSAEPMRLYTFDIFTQPADVGNRLPFSDPVLNWDRAADGTAPLPASVLAQVAAARLRETMAALHRRPPAGEEAAVTTAAAAESPAVTDAESEIGVAARLSRPAPRSGSLTTGVSAVTGGSIAEEAPTVAQQLQREHALAGALDLTTVPPEVRAALLTPPPEDSRIRVDFASDPVVKLLQSIARGRCPGWVFPGEAETLQWHRACVTGDAAPTGIAGSVGGSSASSPGFGDSASDDSGDEAEDAHPLRVGHDGTPLDHDLAPSPAPALSSPPDDATAQAAADCAMAESLVQRFFDLFNAGVSAYLGGDWPSAVALLRAVQELRPGDGPTATLLAAMDDLGEGVESLAPAGWPGYRVLTEK